MVHMASSTRRDWIGDAACKNHPDPSIFFPKRGENDKTLEAQRVCDSCPVQRQCLEEAVLNVTPFGLYGGAGEPVRRHLRRLNLNRMEDEDGEQLVTCAHPGERSREGCGCVYCSMLADHFERLSVLAETGRGPSPAWNINGPRARHGTRACAKRGCDRRECRMTLRSDYEEAGAA